MTRLKRLFMKPDPRECEEVRELMSDYVDDELDGDARDRVDSHVGICPRCHQVLQNLRLTLKRVGLLSGATPPGADTPEDVSARIAQGWRERR